MELIVDVQGFHVPDFVVKELAILSRDGQKLYHFIVKPPFPYKNLSKTARNNVAWLHHNHHGFSWEDGYVEYGEIQNLINFLLKSALKIYVKGDLKKKFVEQYCKENIINLEEKPSMKKFKPEKICFAHAPPHVCSLHNVHVIKQMLDTDIITESVKALMEHIEDTIKTFEELCVT